MPSSQFSKNLALFLSLVLLVVAVYLSATGIIAIFREPGAFQERIAALGLWGPLVAILAQMLQVLIPFIPGQFMGIATGYLYGVFWGTLLSMTGLALGSWLAMWLGRWLGRPLVERVASPELITRMDKLSQRHGLWAFFLVFLLPFLPTDPGCFIAGLTPLPIPALVFLAVLGRLPGLLILNWLGATSQELSWPFAVGLVVFTILIALVLVRYRAQLQEELFRQMERLGID